MSATSPQLSTYYLPVTLATAEDFLERDIVPGLLIERVGLLVMLMASQSEPALRANLSRALTKLCDDFFDSPLDVVEACLREACAEFGQKTTAEICSILSDQGIRFAPEEQMAGGAWRGANGRYTDAFQDHCRNTLMDYEITVWPEVEDEDCETDLEADDWGGGEARSDRAQLLKLRGPRDQARAASAIAAASDEHFSMTAYAGTGKTHLLLALAQSGGRYTHLAPTAAHRQAFLQRVGAGGGMQSTTLHTLAANMANAHVRKSSTRWVNPPRVGDSTWSLSRQVDFIGLPPIGSQLPSKALVTIYDIVRTWCFSADNEITLEHVRRNSHAGLLEDGSAYLAWARKVWDLMSAPLEAKQERAFNFKLYHLVKWLDVSGADIPPMGTLFLDEAHDLPAPWYSLLRRYSQGWVAMGDPYQCLSGRASQAPQAKALSMVQSVRTGEQAMPLFQSVINRHSERLVDEAIVGSRDHVTRPRAYAPDDELPQSGLRVYGSVWKMLEEALRLKDGSARFRFVEASEKVLIEAARDAILLRRSGDRPRSYQLRPFKNWDELSYDLETGGYANVARLFDRGFNEDHLDELTRSQNTDGRSDLTLGLLEHCKNMEFSAVAMSSCCFFASKNARSKDENDKRIKTIYVAMTRVRDELWIPGDALDRLAG
jgi:hypothetical protein